LQLADVPDERNWSHNRQHYALKCIGSKNGFTKGSQTIYWLRHLKLQLNILQSEDFQVDGHQHLGFHLNIHLCAKLIWFMWLIWLIWLKYLIHFQQGQEAQLLLGDGATRKHAKDS